MMDVILREEGEGENLRKWREKRRKETSREKREGRTEEKREKVWKKKCLECRCEWEKYEEKEKMNERM